MTTNLSDSSRLITVHGTTLRSHDTREQYREKLARITLDSMVQFVGLLDAHGTVLEINKVALDAVGIPLSDVEGKPFWTTFWWQVSDEINATLRESIRRAAQGEFVRWDTPIYGRAGGKETIIIDASLMPVRDEHGEVVFIAAEGRDITEKKAYEREIARQREELAKLDVLKTQFFANISHEFRTPLTLMLGPISDALDDRGAPLGEQQRERLSMVRRNGLRLQKLVNALLDFSRVEAGRVQASYRPTDLAALTADLASSFRSACEQAGLRLLVDCPTLPQPVYVDRDMWEKIVLNLLSNAFKFTHAGDIEIRLRAEAQQAILTVRDTGTGIPEEELPRIFERFHRVENAAARTHEGTGIGLALVQELIRLHGGTVEAASRVGEGTTFTVRVPFGKDHLTPEHVGGATQVSTATRADAYVEEALRWLPSPGDASSEIQFDPNEMRSAAGAERPRVLLADDNADMRDYIQRLLSPQYEVEAVGDGAAAIDAARAHAPDLILSDIMMPRLDGLGLLQQLRSDRALRGVPVVLLSARAGKEAEIEGLAAGADDYVVKPFSAGELLARVENNLKMASLRRETSGALRQGELESEQQRRFYETILSSTPDLVYVFGRDYRFTYANQALLTMWGRTLEQSVGKSLLEIGYEPWHAAMHEREIDQVVATRKSIRGEVSFPHATLGRRIYDYIFVPVVNEAGEVERIAGTTRDITDLKQAEEASRQRTAQFETLLNDAPIGVYLVDSDFLISAVNPTAKPYFGLIPNLVGRDFGEVVHILWGKDYANELIQRFRHTLETGEPYVVPERMERRRDLGVDEFYEWRISRIPLPDGKFGVVCYFQDISAQVQARKVIAESEKRFRALVNASSDVVYRMSPDWGEMRHLHGRDFIEDTENPNRSWLQKYIHPDDQAQVMRAITEAVMQQKTFELEHRVLRVDGTVGWTQSRAVPLFDENDRIVEWFGAASDVTGRKLAQEALRESEARFRLIVESAQDFAIFTADFAGNVTSWNSGAERILGYGADEILGRSGAIMFTPEDREAGVPEAEMRAALQKGSAENERWHMRKDGSLFWASGLMMPLKGEGGSVDGFLKILRDRTDKRREEEQRKLLLDELNHRVKNTLSTVQSVAMRTMRSAQSPGDFQRAFGSRLMALSQAHDLLTRSNWIGAELGDVVRQTLSPYFDRTERRITFGGIALKLRPNAAVMLNLVLHELATNAVKYGALSQAAGHVSVTWTVDDDAGRSEAEILWIESGGPAVKAPSRSGFGATLIRRGISEELEGDVMLEFAPGGVECRIRFPIQENVVLA